MRSRQRSRRLVRGHFVLLWMQGFRKDLWLHKSEQHFVASFPFNFALRTGGRALLHVDALDRFIRSGRARRQVTVGGQE